MRAQDLSNSDAGAYLAELPLFERDPEYAHLWTASGAALAFEAGHEADAHFWLDRALEHGFFQVELFPTLSALLEVHPDAKHVRARLESNAPVPPVTLLDWPDAPLHLPLRLGNLLPEREAALCDQLPPAGATALETALDVLAWAHARWAHTGDNGGAQGQDALAILERAARGERFRCVEYGVVLAAALCARGIPARVLRLRLARYHAGLGAGHIVTEAWIDDLNAWAPLDGQNGAYWADEVGAPLATTELHRRCRAGEAPPRFLDRAGQSVPEPELWWRYFAHVSAGAEVVSPGEAFVPVFQGEPMRGALLTRHAQAVRPDLSDLRTRLGSGGEGVTVRFEALHPYARSVEIDGEAVSEEGWPLDGQAGTHTREVRVRTPFGTLRPRSLNYKVAERER